MVKNNKGSIMNLLILNFKLKLHSIIQLPESRFCGGFCGELKQRETCFLVETSASLASQASISNQQGFCWKLQSVKLVGSLIQ